MVVTGNDRVRIPLGSLSALCRANQLQQRLYSLLQSASINKGDSGLGCILPFFEIILADLAGLAATRETCSNSSRQTEPSSKVHLGLFTAILKRDGDWWIGWVEEVPGVNAQERSREELLASFRVILAEALEFNRNEARAAAESGFEEEYLSV